MGFCLFYGDCTKLVSFQLTRAKYSQEACKGMIANPSDRVAAGRAMFEIAGVKLHSIWYSGNGGVICIVEGIAVAGSTVGMGVIASSGFTSVESTELITMGQMIEAIKGGRRGRCEVPSAWQVARTRPLAANGTPEDAAKRTRSGQFLSVASGSATATQRPLTAVTASSAEGRKPLQNATYRGDRVSLHQRQQATRAARRPWQRVAGASKLGIGRQRAVKADQVQARQRHQRSSAYELQR